jgi:hypothetical protein
MKLKLALVALSLGSVITAPAFANTNLTERSETVQTSDLKCGSHRQHGAFAVSVKTALFARRPQHGLATKKPSMMFSRKLQLHSECRILRLR